MAFSKNILCIGAGYVGSPTMAVIAKQWPEYSITVVDINPARIEAWNSDRLPIYEPGLDAIVFECRNKNLFFTTDIDGGIANADIIFVSVNTPTKMFGQGAGRAADLQYWEKTARQIVRCSARDKIIVEKSTLPVKTAEAMESILHTNDKGLRFDVLSNPEFLAEGTAVRDLLNPDRVLIGSRETPEGVRARKALAVIYARWVPAERILETNVWSAELSKLVSNAFLAQRISSINAISALCERTGADVDQVAHAVGMDTRIGPRFLKASVGFGGSCFQKDILHLVYLCEHYGLPEVAAYWEQVVSINDWQQQRFVRTMMAAMFDTLVGKRIALFGVAFKADTGDTRESPALKVARALVAEGARVVVTDFKALENARTDLADLGDKVTFTDSPEAAASGAHAIAVMTEWEQFKSCDYKRLFDSMEKPAFLFDGRNILDCTRLFEIGFNVYPLGKEPLTRL